jgi:transcriptional regulator with XRE-family HTH domain
VTGPHPAVQWSVNVGRIERARVLNAWTRKHLADVAHVDPKTLSDMCNGRRRPSFGTVQAVCVALGLTMADVIVFEENVNRPSLSARTAPPGVNHVTFQHDVQFADRPCRGRDPGP